MRFFVVFAALAPLLALRPASLGSSHDGSSFCPCIGKDDRPECVEGTLASYVLCPDDFGIGCKTHNISKDCAASLYQSIDVGKQLQCGPSHSGESPWCNTSWCYVNDSNCIVDWDWGVLGPYSYATCGNLRQGSDKYFQKTLAAFLQDDPLRVFHAESTLEGGYLGNTGCKKVYKYSQNRHCKGRVAEFWERSLDKLNLPKIDHTVIERDEEEEDIRHYFMDPNITNQFEDYKDRVPLHWSERPTTNFDLCAFATGMGYVDLCSGAFSLTHRRQAMTYVIELYTSPVFMVSKSTCRVFFASEDWRSWKFWFWWVDVFSPGAWGFFVGVVFFFILAMKGLDKCLDCLDNLDKQSGEEPEEQGEPEGPPEEPEKPQEEAQRRMEKFCKCFCCFTHGLADALLGVFEAFVHKSKTSHRRDSKKPSRSRPSHMLRLGLGFFILLSMAMYFAKITADMVLANEVKGEVPSLKDAKKGPNSVSLCTHSVYNESLTLHLNGNAYISANYMDKWEEVLDNLKNETCKAALLDDEAWNTFRSRGELCGYYKEPTVEFYIPTGVVVSKRAYRTLESFRLAPNETPVFWSEVIGHDCRSNSTTCDSTKLGVPWYTFPGPSVVAGVCGLCSLLGIAHHRFVGRDEEYEEEQEKERKKEEMYRNIARLPRIGEEMTIANIERLFDRGFQQNMFQLLQLAEGAGPAPQDAAEPENQDGEACQGQTGAASSSQNPTLLQNLSSHHPHQTPGASLGK